MDSKIIYKNVDSFHQPPADQEPIKAFNEWAIKNGVIMPKLKYPGYFDGLCGVLCQEEILKQEAFLYVPLKMVVSTGKAKVHPVLGEIMK